MQKQKALEAATDLVDLLKGGDFRSSWVERKSREFEILAAELILSNEAPCIDFINAAMYSVAWLIPEEAGKLVRAAIAKAQDIGCSSWRELAPRPTVDEIVKSLENLISRLRESASIQGVRVKERANLSGAMTPKQLAKKLDVSLDTLRKYARCAKVRTPEGKGHSNFNYNAESIESICLWIKNNPTRETIADRAQKLLNEIRK